MNQKSIGPFRFVIKGGIIFDKENAWLMRVRPE